MSDCAYNPASEYYCDFILRYRYNNPEMAYEFTRTPCLSFISGEYVVVYTRTENVTDLNIADYSYSAIPKLYGLLDAPALEASEIPAVFALPALRATGRGVLLGFIDTGIDYRNPLFQNADGSTRILGLWDQTVGNETPPPDIPDGYAAQFPYGTIYGSAQINEALASESPLALVPSTDENGHGTFMASVAAGRDHSDPGRFVGAAPEAVLAVVKLKPAKQYLRDFFLIPDDIPAYQENDIMSGVAFLLYLSMETRLPLVIYLGVGTNQGSHDGSAPLGQLLQGLYGYPGIAAVIGAGNETGYRRHYYGNMDNNQVCEEVEIRVGENERGFCAELWAREPDLFTVGFVSPYGEEIARISLALGRNTKIPFRRDRTEITLNYVNYEAGSGSQLIFMRFEAPAAGIWRIRVYPVIHATGQFHIWLPQQQFLSGDTYFLKPDPDVTIVDPGNASTPTTVGAYDYRNGGIWIHSSRGFTRSGQIKPDLAAPGVSIQGAAVTPPSNPTDADTSGSLREQLTGASGSASPLSTVRSGTSVAAAITAGAIADIFTWAIADRNDPTLSGAAAQSMLIRGAAREDAYVYPGREWGYGKLNLYQAFFNETEG